MKLSIIYNQCTEYRFSRGRGSLVAPIVLLLYNLVGQPVVCVVQSFNKSHFAFRDSRLYGFWLYLRTVCFVSGIIVPCPLLSYLPVRLFLLSPRRYFWSAFFCLLICGSQLLIVSKKAHRQDFCKISCMTAAYLGKVSAQPHTIVKQICFPNGNVLFFSLFSLVKYWMHNVVWGCAEILALSVIFPAV